MHFAVILFALLPATTPIPLRFDHAPLGNVARVLSARFHCPISLQGHATAPITADLTGLDLPQALKVAADQADLEVHPLGRTAADGFALRSHPKPDPAAVRAEASRRRAELLRQRTLLEQADTAQAGS